MFINTALQGHQLVVYHCEYKVLISDLVQTIDVLLNATETSSASTGYAEIAGNGATFSLLADLGKAVAVGAEAGEDLDEITTGNLHLKVGLHISLTHFRWWPLQ